MIEPRTFVEVPRGTRRRVEALIETLVELLDALDGDCDLEDDELEFEPAELVTKPRRGSP